MADWISDTINSFGKTGVPLVLVVGGVMLSFFSGIAGRFRGPVDALSMLSIGAGVALFANNTVFATAKATFPISTDIETRRYANPVNNLSSIPKNNRFDLQTNYILGNPDSNEDYMNDLILSEAKALGGGAGASYPVRLNPWEVKTLIPTTQVEPSRDFNTVKMVMA